MPAKSDDISLVYDIMSGKNLTSAITCKMLSKKTVFDDQ
jgi:hypothetical protein